ncbi:MAG TPA: ANTAR domain-containing protein [Chloroflexota bacterium]|nr:ANTAR domain-containing protein [Chloroflexota bacterium]
MIKVLVVDNTPDRASSLERALAAMPGVEVACIVESPLELFARVAEHKPDVVLIETNSPSRDVLEQLAAVSGSAPRPVVMFTEDAHDDTIRAALAAGVSAYIVDGLSPGRLAPIMRVAMERFEVDQRLRAELEDTRARLDERKLVERAKGILMKQRGLDEDAAYAALRSHAMQRGLRLGDAARQLIDIAALLG